MGDLFLPQPYRNNSKKIRSDLNEFLVGLLPKKDSINLQPTQETLKKVEQGRVDSPL
jgi:hypothetical protein